MDPIIQILNDFSSRHGVKLGTIALAVGIFSALANIMIRVRTPAQWVTFMERRPVLSSLVRMLRAGGIDPIGFIQACVAFLGAVAKALGASAIAANAVTKANSIPPPAPPMSSPPPPEPEDETEPS